MADGGWIKLYRKLRESFVWTDSRLLKLWLLILMKASHDGNEFLFNGQVITVSSGQMVTGRDALAFEYNKGVPRVQQVVGRTLWRWLKLFEKAEMVSIKSESKYSVITVIHWDTYQSGVQQVSSKRPANVQQMSTIKNAENAKKEPNSPAKAEPEFNYAGVIEYLNKKSGKHFRDTPNNRKLIKARLNDGFTSHDIAVVINNVCAGYKGTDMERYIQPSTIFRPSKFEGYLNAVPRPINSDRGFSPEQPVLETPHTFSAVEYAISAYQTGSSIDEIIEMAKDEGAPATPDEIRAAIDAYNKQREEDS